MDLISEFVQLSAKPSGFPIKHNNRLALDTINVLKYPERYRRLVGRLIYLAVTRLDLSYVEHRLAQFMQAPTRNQWDTAHGILLRSDSDLQLNGWCDSDWVGCPISRRSLTGWFIQLGNSPISWKTRKLFLVLQLKLSIIISRISIVNLDGYVVFFLAFELIIHCDSK